LRSSTHVTFYRAVSFGAVPKNDDIGYKWVQSALVKLRMTWPGCAARITASG